VQASPDVQPEDALADEVAAPAEEPKDEKW